MINPMDLSGKKILVTGASSGIGKETALHAARLGASVIMIARGEDLLQETLNQMEAGDHRYYPADLSQIDQIEELTARIRVDNGPFDGFVHCAGITENRPIKMFKYENVHRLMLINFYSYIELIRCITKRGAYNEGMSIVGISSIAAVTCKAAQTIYAASKAAMNTATKCLAMELSSKNIRLNTIVPAMIETDMSKKYMERYNRTNDFFKADGGMGVGEPIDVANMAVYLLSGAAKFITRSEIEITGGYHGQVG